MYYNSEQGKIRFDSKDEFDAWFKLYEGENILYYMLLEEKLNPRNTLV